MNILSNMGSLYTMMTQPIKPLQYINALLSPPLK